MIEDTDITRPLLSPFRECFTIEEARRVAHAMKLVKQQDDDGREAVRIALDYLYNPPTHYAPAHVAAKFIVIADQLRIMAGLIDPRYKLSTRATGYNMSNSQ